AMIWSQVADAHKECIAGNMKRGLQKTTVATPEENDYDVTTLEFNLELTNTSTFVQGYVATHARALIPNFSVYAFELDNALTVDSVIINNQALTVTTNGAIRKATLLNPLPVNTDFIAYVYYHGSTPSGN